MKYDSQTDYTARINTVFDYIDRNLDRDISLDELAEVSCFSKYHFSRIFTKTVGETPFEFIRRVRLEKAASMLRHHQDKTVTEIAMHCGYNDLAVFSRAFTDYFDKSPTQVRNNALKKSNTNQIINTYSKYFGDEQHKNPEQLQSAEVHNLPKRTVAYIRHTGPYRENLSLYEYYFEKLFSWGVQQNLADRRNASLMAIYHDAPCVADNGKLRLSFGLPVPPDTPVDGEIGKMNLPNGRFLKARFIIAPEEIPVAWKWVYESWFPGSGYRQADGLPFEVYPKHPENGESTVEICVPLTPL